MTRYVGAAEAARLLGVQKATLYAYVSRGLVGADGRRRRAHVAVRRRRPRGAGRPRPRRHESEPRAVARRADRHRRHHARRGRRRATAATTSPSSPGRAPTSRSPSCCGPARSRAAVEWPPAGRRRCRPGRRRHSAVGRRHGVPAMVATASALGVHHPADDPPAAARRLLGVVPTVLGGPAADGGGVAARLAACWRPTPARWPRRSTGRSCCSPTTSWRRARSPCASPARRGPARTRRSPPGWPSCRAPLHGGAARQVHALLVECEEIGAAAAVGRRLQARERLPGFGHSIYQGDDPRLAPLLEAVALLPDPDGRVRRRRRPAGRDERRLTRRPNVDLGLGALASSAGCPPTCRCSPSPASPASPPTSTRSCRSARCATAAWPARRARDRRRSGRRAGRRRRRRR